LLPACRSISPRAFANVDDTNANITFTNCAFTDNVFDSWGCEDIRGWFCWFGDSPGAAGVTTASNVTFKGSTSFKRNSWGALYVAAPVTVTFEGAVVVADNTKELGYGTESDNGDYTSQFGGGLYASAGARLLFSGSATFR
jgi:hypothetical protein